LGKNYRLLGGKEIMAMTNRWAIREVGIASFFDTVTGELKVKLDTLKMSGLDNTSAVVYASGSRGNPKLVGFSGSRAAKFTLQDALFTNDMIGMLTGNEVVTGAASIIKDDVLTVANDTATLSLTPSETGALLSVNKLNADGTKGDKLTFVATAPTANQYSVTGKTLTFASDALADGSKVQVYYYTESGEETKQIRVSADKFAGSYKLVLDVLVRDAYTKKDFAAQIVVPNAKIEDTWKLEMKPDGDPSVLDIPMEALKPSNSADLFTMNIYDEADLA
jgi:hypothetical protein